MNAVDRLLDEYIAEHRAGGVADPRAFLARVQGADRAELAVLIDGYLSRAPRQAINPNAPANRLAERTVDELDRSLTGRSGLWPALLPQLRHRAGLRRSELVSRLAQSLGVADREAKVAEYYHRMEQGRLPAGGVSGRVLTAIGEIVGSSTQALREAGEAVAPSPGEPRPAAAFTRRAMDEAARHPATPRTQSDAPQRDEVDDMFTGG